MGQVTTPWGVRRCVEHGGGMPDKAIIEAYKRGESVAEIARQHSISRPGVYAILRRHGVQADRRVSAGGDSMAVALEMIERLTQQVIDVSAELGEVRHIARGTLWSLRRAVEDIDAGQVDEARRRLSSVADYIDERVTDVPDASDG